MQTFTIEIDENWFQVADGNSFVRVSTRTSATALLFVAPEEPSKLGHGIEGLPDEGEIITIQKPVEFSGLESTDQVWVRVLYGESMKITVIRKENPDFLAPYELLPKIGDYRPELIATLFQDDPPTVPVAYHHDPVAHIVDQSQNGLNHAVQSVDANRPLYITDGPRHALGENYDISDPQDRWLTLPMVVAAPFTIGGRFWFDQTNAVAIGASNRTGGRRRVSIGVDHEGRPICYAGGESNIAHGQAEMFNSVSIMMAVTPDLVSLYVDGELSNTMSLTGSLTTYPLFLRALNEQGDAMEIMDGAIFGALIADVAYTRAQAEAAHDYWAQIAP